MDPSLHRSGIRNDLRDDAIRAPGIRSQPRRSEEIQAAINAAEELICKHTEPTVRLLLSALAEKKYLPDFDANVPFTPECLGEYLNPSNNGLVNTNISIRKVSSPEKPAFFLVQKVIHLGSIKSEDRTYEIRHTTGGYEVVSYVDY